jgi:hypothetical protein
MSYRDGIRRDIQAKRQREKSAEQERMVQRISDLVPLARTGQMSPAKFLQITREILDGDADRIVRVGHEIRPDIQTGEGR